MSPANPDLAALARAFPFHLLITPDLRVAGLGAGLLRLDPALVPDVLLDAHFSLREPVGQPLTWAALTTAPDSDFCLVHRASQLELRGRMALPDPNGPVLFLGTSWLDDAEQLADFGVALDAVRPQVFPVVAPPAPTASRPDDAGSLAARCGRLEQCLRLHQTVSNCLAESRDADGALDLLVDALPAALGWPGAVRWQLAETGEPIALRSMPAIGVTAEATVALARQAFKTGSSLWSADGCGGQGGFALTASAEGGTVGVITCLSDRLEADDELAKALYVTAGQLARFLIRQQQKGRLTRLTSELSAIFQLCEDGIVAFNGDGVLSYLNPAFARMVGLDRDDLRGRDEAYFEQRLAALLDPRQPVRRAGNGDRVIQLAQPRTTVLQRSQRDARDLDGRLVGRLYYFRDITLETELLRANGEFLSNAAHELRTPMASIHGFVDLLLKRELPAAQQRQVLETIRRQSSRLSEIVDELLEVARFDARAARDLDRQAQPLTPIIRATVAELLIRDDPRPVLLTLPEDAASPWVCVDRDRLTQVLVNVLSNAYKYSPDGGDITLQLLDRTRSEQRWVGIAVRDHGIGMTADELKRLFDRFFRAHPAGAIPGTGLGMSLIKKIIDAHGGIVEVDSTPGEGTEIRLWLPETAPLPP